MDGHERKRIGGPDARAGLGYFGFRSASRVVVAYGSSIPPSAPMVATRDLDIVVWAIEVGFMHKPMIVLLSASLLLILPSGCFEDINNGRTDTNSADESGEGDGDGDPSGDGDGDPNGDGDGDPTGDGDPSGDGDEDPSGDGDGDEDPSGDGDGDEDPSGDGDGEPSDPCTDCATAAYGVGGACYQQYQACQANDDCKAVYNCVVNCGGDMQCGMICFNGGTDEAKMLYLVLVGCMVGPDGMSGACGAVCT
jgi:hypothetical protein